MAETKLEALDRITDLLQKDGLTERRFLEMFKKVVNLVRSNDKETKDKIFQLKDLLDKRLDQIEKDTKTSQDISVQKVEAAIDSLKAFTQQQEVNINQKLSEVRDGVDADEDEVVDRATERVKNELFIPTTEDLLNDVPALAERIRDALELLEEDERLKASSIAGLEDLIESVAGLEGKINNIRGAASVPSPMHWQRNESFTVGAATTSVTLAQAPGQAGTAVIVWYQGQALEPGNHYTVDGTNINFSGVTFADSTTVTVSYWP